MHIKPQFKFFIDKEPNFVYWAQLLVGKWSWYFEGENSKNLHLLFSKDDDVVPASHADKYKQKLKNIHVVIYKSKGGHFNIAKFPEIIKMIFADIKKN